MTHLGCHLAQPHLQVHPNQEHHLTILLQVLVLIVVLVVFFDLVSLSDGCLVFIGLVVADAKSIHILKRANDELNGCVLIA